MAGMDMPAVNEADVTPWLQQLDAGSSHAVDQLFAALYSELKRQAVSQMRKESAGHT